jgi:excisionase family DNA binding protein
MDEDGTPAVDNLLSASQVAERVGLTHRSVSRLVNTGAIPIVGRFGIQKQLVFREEDVDAYIEEHHKSS